MGDKIIAYSNKKNDGFGSVYLCCLNCFATARLHGKIYKHTNFYENPNKNEYSLHHNYNKDKNYTKIMNDFTGLKSDSSYNENVEIIYHINNRLNSVQGGFSINDVNKYYTPDVLNEIRKMYYSTWKPDPISSDIAVHIRRGDIAIANKKGTYGSDRYIELSYFKEIINTLRIKNYKKPLKIIIFSEGKNEDFLELESDDTKFYLNYDLRITFHSMVKAPILITSKSMLSIAASLLNENDVYYTKWSCFNPLKHWIII